MVAHESQLVPVPEDLSDEEAVMVEPTACAVHAARTSSGGDATIIGAGALGLLTLAALRHLHPDADLLITAKHPEQRRLAEELGADRVVDPDDARAHDPPRHRVDARRLTADRWRRRRLRLRRHRGLAHPGARRWSAPAGPSCSWACRAGSTVDLTSLWHRETAVRGCYAYERADFDTAIELVRSAGLGRLVSATYPLARYEEAIEHAARAGTRGAVSIAFDLRGEKERTR